MKKLLFFENMEIWYHSEVVPIFANLFLQSHLIRTFASFIFVIKCHFSTFRDDDKDWRDAWHTRQPCSSSRRATLISHLHNDCEPAAEFLDRLPRRSHRPALRSDLHSRRPTGKLQILSWNPGPARGSDPSLLFFAPHQPMACDLRAGGVWLRHGQLPAGELPRGQRAPLCRTP